MNRRFRAWSFLLPAVAAVVGLFPATAAAEVKYSTFTKDGYGRLVWLQPAYYPLDVLGEDLYEPDPGSPDGRRSSPLRNPKDIFIDANDEIYIADTGNNRIVHLSKTGEPVRFLTVPESPLSRPEGVFVTAGGDIYVADTGNKRVVRLDRNGKLLKEYKRPESRFISAGFVFEPGNLIVDNRGFLYITVHGSYEGLVVLDPDGRFQGFFGANRTVLSPLDALKRMLYPKRMYENEVPKRPETINSVATDKNGFIYTVSGSSARGEQLKKLNVKGVNLLRGAQGRFGETAPWDTEVSATVSATTSSSTPAATGPQLVDVTVDENGNMIVVDQRYKYISHYDASGKLLYFWGGASAVGSSQIGLLKSPVAVEVNSKNELYVLDDQENLVQVFRLSEFGEKVDRANQLSLAGLYEESEGPWREVLRMNAQFTPAILGLAQLAFKREQYEEARRLFREAGDPEGYSNAFWEIRMRWFQRHFSEFATAATVLATVYLGADRLGRRYGWSLRRPASSRKRRTLPFFLELRHALYILRHPIDGYAAVRYENKGSVRSALFVLVTVYAALLVREYATGFAFHPTPRPADPYSIFTRFFIVWFAWTLANYLVGSIYRGEGRYRDIFIGSAYALLPYVVVGVPLSLLSNVMTLSEASIYRFLEQGMLLWTCLLFFWKVQNVHNYSVGETLMNIFLTFCTMLGASVLLFMTVGLTGDFLSLIREMVQEVRLR